MLVDDPSPFLRRHRAALCVRLLLGLGALCVAMAAGAETVLVTLEKDNAVAVVDGLIGVRHAPIVQFGRP